tara:strand:+ start:1092 stop:1358 length:267 start_codon:yes stop_codon:yes gene_type:complete
MTDNANLQRRGSDQVKEKNSRRNETIATIAIILGGAWWVAGQAAKEEVLPIRDIAMRNSTIVDILVLDMASIKSDIKELLKLSQEKDK